VRTDTAVLFIFISLALPGFVVPVAGTLNPGDNGRVWPIATSHELNATGTDITNHTLPSRYGISPTLIDIKVEVSDTSLPGPKGEMAAGPRAIGFSADLVSLAILIVAIIAGGAGIWYLIKRKPGEDEVDEERD
jgi:hypothetical protein